MKKGKIVEQGTHEELIHLDGTYNKLVTMQSLE
jgi:subfamily B ATP-binding cassette protein MsbA